MLKRKDLLGLIDLTKEELTEILDVAADMKRHLKEGDKQLPYLKGKTATILFYENSNYNMLVLVLICGCGIAVATLDVGFFTAITILTRETPSS